MADAEKNSGKTVQNIQEQRDLMAHLVVEAEKASIEFDRHTKSIGASVKDLTKLVKLEAAHKNVAAEISSIQLTLIHALEMDMKYTSYKNIEGKKILDDLKEQISLMPKAGSIMSDIQEKKLAQLNDELDTEVKKQAAMDAELITRKDTIDASIKCLKHLEKESQLWQKRIDQQKLIQKLSEKTGIAKVIEIFKTGAWIKLLEEAWNIFKKMDDAMFSIRKHLGTFRGESKEIEATAKSLAMNFAGVGVTFETAAATMNSIVDDFGSLSSHTENIAGTIATFSSQLGISEKTSTGLLKNLTQISGKTLNSTEGMLGFTKSLSNAAGVPLPKVMEDIAGASDSVRANFRGNTIELIKATVEARRMGLSLESMGKTSESLLDFNSSVNAEMEASVLIGKNLNLNAARRAAFNGDLVKQNQEILKVLQSVGDFEKLNAFQKKSLATALGKSVEELQSMNQREQERLRILRSGSKEQKEMLATYEKQKSLRENEAKDLGKMDEDRIKRENHQQRVNALQQQFYKLILDLSKPMLDVVEPIMELAVKWMPTLFEGFAKLLVPLTFVTAIINRMTSAATTVSTGLKLWGTPVAKIGATLSRVGGFVFGIGKFAAGVLAFFGKWINPIGWVITAFQFIYSLFKRFSDIEFVSGDWTGNIWKGLEAVRGAIYDTLLKPFVDVYDWIMEKLGAHSPSEVGLAIVTGLKAVGSMIFDVLFSPFKMAYDFVTDLFGKIPEFISSVFKKGIDFAMKLPGMGLLMKAVNAISGTPNTESAQATPKSVVEKDDTNLLILNKLTELTDLLRAGAISINMDGRRVSEALAHTSSR